MIGMLARFLVFRLVPRRLLPLLTAWQVVQMLRSRRNRSAERPSQRR